MVDHHVKPRRWCRCNELHGHTLVDPFEHGGAIRQPDVGTSVLVDVNVTLQDAEARRAVNSASWTETSGNKVVPPENTTLVIGTSVGATHSSNDAVACAHWYWRHPHPPSVVDDVDPATLGIAGARSCTGLHTRAPRSIDRPGQNGASAPNPSKRLRSAGMLIQPVMANEERQALSLLEWWRPCTRRNPQRWIARRQSSMHSLSPCAI